jgi:hypothetical protein
VSATVSIPATGGWQTWKTVSVPVTLAAGKQMLTLRADAGQFNVDSIVVASAASSTTSPTPYGGTAAAIPGTIQAENFDNGGKGVAYSDTTSGNSGGAYRSTDVDIELASGGGYDIGWIAAGEWLNYTVNVATAGTYTVKLRVAAPTSGSALHVGFNNTSNVWAAVSITSTA